MKLYSYDIKKYSTTTKNYSIIIRKSCYSNIKIIVLLNKTVVL